MCLSEGDRSGAGPSLSKGVCLGMVMIAKVWVPVWFKQTGKNLLLPDRWQHPSAGIAKRVCGLFTTAYNYDAAFLHFFQYESEAVLAH